MPGMYGLEPSPDDRRELESLMNDYIRATLRRDFARAVEVLYPGDLDKFRKSVLWCARAMEPFGESRPFLEVFGHDIEIEDLEVLSPPDFTRRFLAGVTGTCPPDELEKVLRSVAITGIVSTGEDTAEVGYAFGGAPCEDSASKVEKSMRFQRVGERWYGLLDPGFTRTPRRVRRQVEAFERRRSHDLDPETILEWDLEPFALHGFRDTESGRTAIEPRFADAGEFRDGLAPVKFFKLWGFINRAGQTVIEPRFTNALPFSEGLAAVAVTSDGFEQKWGYIDTGGDELCEFKFDRAESFSEGLAAVRVDELWGYISKSGELVIEPRFHSVEPFDGGEAEVLVETESGGEWVVIDVRGEIREE